ncbi:MAG: hypothetical protein HY327_09955 [Chloroflexi bacterium]|nr:hypothetical protein [Chloroflexota bacterium]
MPSKLTFHLMSFDDKIFDLLARMQPSIVKVYDFPSDANIDEIRRRCPKSLIVYRQYTNLTFNNAADAYVNELQDAFNKLKGRGIVWEGLNEPVLSSIADANALNTWFVRFAQLMHARGEKVAAFSFSTGNPKLEYVPLLADAATACDYLALHEYYYPVGGASDLARYRQFRDQLPAAARKPILITETGVDGGQNDGWLAHVSEDQYMQILADYDKELLKDADVVGATIFQYGAGAPWSSFDVKTIGTRIADYVANAGGGAPLPASDSTADAPGSGSGGATQPPPTSAEKDLQQSVLAEAQKFTWMPINDQAALYQYAQEQNLGYPQTDEFEYTFNGAAYLAQVFNLGIVYVKKGDWGNVKWVKKPNE